ncbi:ketosteroid isomerase-like protein [Pseudomonas laurylsulfatiphila]|uniref:nuclear transport factor 2 family protein n=1 Tax=Pseudomonas laurylsulfatiphila TaxID=2011015 RepID=UPI003D1B0C33
MSKAIVQRFYEYAGNGRFADAGALFADDVHISFYGPSSVPHSGEYHGAEGVGKFFGIVGGTLDVEAFEPLEFIEEGESVVVIGQERSRVKHNGAEFLVQWVQVWSVKGGKIVRLRDYFDTGTMAEAFAAKA